MTAFEKSGMIGGLSGSLMALRSISSSVMASMRAQSVRSGPVDSPSSDVTMRPLFPVTRSRGNDSYISAALGIGDCDVAVFNDADDRDPFFGVLPCAGDFKRRAVPDGFGTFKVDPVFFKITLSFLFIPFKLHYLTVAQMCTRTK